MAASITSTTGTANDCPESGRITGRKRKLGRPAALARPSAVGHTAAQRIGAHWLDSRRRCPMRLETMENADAHRRFALSAQASRGTTSLRPVAQAPTYIICRSAPHDASSYKFLEMPSRQGVDCLVTDSSAIRAIRAIRLVSSQFSVFPSRMNRGSLVGRTAPCAASHRAPRRLGRVP